VTWPDITILCPQVNISWSWKPSSSSPCWCPGTKCTWTAPSQALHRTRWTRNPSRGSAWLWPIGAASESGRWAHLCGSFIWAMTRTPATGNSCFSERVVEPRRERDRFDVILLLLSLSVCEVDYYYIVLILYSNNITDHRLFFIILFCKLLRRHTVQYIFLEYNSLSWNKGSLYDMSIFVYSTYLVLKS